MAVGINICKLERKNIKNKNIIRKWCHFFSIFKQNEKH